MASSLKQHLLGWVADIQAQVSMYEVGTLSENLIYKEIYSKIKKHLSS